MAKYRQIGGGSWGVYQKKPRVWPWVVGGLILSLIMLANA